MDLCKKLNISKNVIFLGDVPNDKISIFMNFSDLVVIQSVSIGETEESACILALEAMSMKKPVVATNWGGLKDSIVNGKNGLLINERILMQLLMP